MPRPLYCWRCETEVPMLDEAEWAQLAPLLETATREAMDWVRTQHGHLADAWPHTRALRKYNEITGLSETDINIVQHHRAADYGPPCRRCGRPLRTPHAAYCANCGEVARPDSDAQEN